MPDIPDPAAVPCTVPAGSLASTAMSVDDYARVVQSRTAFVDFLLAPARDRLAVAA
ncbi:hypothetical protein [Kocuria dechangensis]|uniref:hypothetical protein n=1 Tax=Kocuria dechangensis TaxID=1176249 RepID=UPI001666452E|nr:hypothetical protein [Kocuria dechangensis]